MPSDYKTGGPVTLTEAQILELHQKLRDMRHDVNGRLAHITAVAELIRIRPDQAREERLQLLLDESFKAKDIITAYSREFETAFGLIRA
jgi:uncharacterized protein YciW